MENSKVTELQFYPRHPSSLKTLRIETTNMPILKQEKPFAAKELWAEFMHDQETFFARYTDKRFEVMGVVKKTGPDIHNKPSIELSDRLDGQTYILAIFPSERQYDGVQIGDSVVIRSNYLVMSNWYGLVMKHSEIVKRPGEVD